jgi:hypothetical protein
MSPRKSFPLRIEPSLYQELERWAQQELRSVNGQIEYLLKQAVARRKHGQSWADTTTADTPRVPQPAAPSNVTAVPPAGVARPSDDG